MRMPLLWHASIPCGQGPTKASSTRRETLIALRFITTIRYPLRVIDPRMMRDTSPTRLKIAPSLVAQYDGYPGSSITSFRMVSLVIWSLALLGGLRFARFKFCDVHAALAFFNDAAAVAHEALIGTVEIVEVAISRAATIEADHASTGLFVERLQRFGDFLGHLGWRTFRGRATAEYWPVIFTTTQPNGMRPA